LKAGDNIKGVIRGNGGHDCYVLETIEGSRWELEVDADVPITSLIGRGKDCAAVAKWDLRGKTHSNIFMADFTREFLRFTAAGGLYLVKVAPAFDSPGAKYGLTVQQNPKSPSEANLPRGLLPAPKVIAGTASTVAPSTSAASFTPGQAFRDCDLCPELTVLPAGKFMMGSPNTEEGRSADESPMHPVTIAHPFSIGKTEVTFEQYEACVVERGCEAPHDDRGWGRGRRPVIGIGYEDALHYVAWLSAKTGAQYFIPSEAEWEYAARAGNNTPWNTGTAIITADANFLNTFGKTVPVGSYPPNAFGLHDMHGNVWEWTQDCMDAGYLGAPQDGSAATSGDCINQRVIRGGSYDKMPEDLRSAKRLTASSEHRNYANLGFRVARAL
jgi:formylglycine-generating enzyme required for sulfatase activity